MMGLESFPELWITFGANRVLFDDIIVPVELNLKAFDLLMFPAQLSLTGMTPRFLGASQIFSCVETLVLPKLMTPRDLTRQHRTFIATIFIIRLGKQDSTLQSSLLDAYFVATVWTSLH